MDYPPADSQLFVLTLRCEARCYDGIDRSQRVRHHARISPRLRRPSLDERAGQTTGRPGTRCFVVSEEGVRRADQPVVVGGPVRSLTALPSFSTPGPPTSEMLW